MQSLDEVVQDAQATAAGIFVDAPTRDGGTQRAVASPVEFVGVPTAPTRPVPQLGEHTEAVLREAGLDDAALAKLRAAGAIKG